MLGTQSLWDRVAFCSNERAAFHQEDICLWAHGITAQESPSPGLSQNQPAWKAFWSLESSVRVTVKSINSKYCWMGPPFALALFQGLSDPHNIQGGERRAELSVSIILESSFGRHGSRLWVTQGPGKVPSRSLINACWKGKRERERKH